MDRGAWRATVHRVAKSRTCLSEEITATSQGTRGRCGQLALLSLLKMVSSIPNVAGGWNTKQEVSAG